MADEQYVLEINILRDPVFVYPRQENLCHHGLKLSLSLLDRQAPLFMYTLYFYRKNEERNDDVFTKLKEAMEKLLDLYYPAAGRIVTDVIDCTPHGVMLLEASTACKFEELRDLRDANPQFRKLVYQLQPVPENALVVCQVTRFACGGFVIGFGSRHDLFDGLSALYFLKDWASLARGVVAEDIEKPCHERDTLKPRKSRFNRDELQKLFMERFDGIPLMKHINFDARSEYVTKVFNISNEMISDLKKNALAVCGEQFSTFELLTAHAWISRMRALQIPDTEKVLLEFTVNARSKIALPEKFAGNAFIMAYSNQSAGEIMSRPFHDVLKIIREAKDNVTETFIWDSVNVLEQEAVEKGILPSFRETTIVADWLKMPLHQLDFGWGPAAFATPVAMPLLDVIFLLRDGLHDGQICLRLGLLPDAMKRFEQHFLSPPNP